MTAILSDPNYTPEKLIDFAKNALGVKNDAQLSRKLEFAPPTICKIRRRTAPVGAVFLVRLSEMADTPTRELKKLMGVST